MSIFIYPSSSLQGFGIVFCGGDDRIAYVSRGHAFFLFMNSCHCSKLLQQQICGGEACHQVSHYLTQPMDPEKKSLNFIFTTKYVIPKSLKG